MSRAQPNSPNYREYCAWRAMRTRCTNPNEAEFKRYGARGIRVCDRWLHGDGDRDGYECFLADMGPRPSDQHSLDRIDNSADYSPDNCRWTDRYTQARNVRTNHMLEYRGQRMTVAEAAERFGLTYHCLWMRITRHGWPVDRALTTPMRADARRAPDFIPGATHRRVSSSQQGASLAP